MVLCSVKIYDIFFECFVALASSGHCQTFFSRLISCQPLPFFIYLKDRFVLQTVSVSIAAPIGYQIQVLEAIGAGEQRASGL